MLTWGYLVRLLLVPGLGSALVVGLVCRGLAAWLAALLHRRPLPPPWLPLREIVHLAGKPAQRGPTPQTLAAWPALLGIVALAWATALLPWPRWPQGEDMPAGLLLYLVLLAVPALARLTAAALSAYPLAALGARRQAPVEVARLLPLFLAGLTMPLLTHYLGLRPTAPWSLPSILLGLAAAAVLLLALPWPLWDDDAHDAPLSGLGGRILALFRALEAMELAAHVGLVAVALLFTGLLPSGQGGWALPISAALVTIALAMFQGAGRRPLLPESARAYTRWLLPLAVALAFLGWWFGPY